MDKFKINNEKIDINYIKFKNASNKLKNNTKFKKKLKDISKKVEVMFYSNFFKDMLKGFSLSSDMTTSDYFDMFSPFFTKALAEKFAKENNYKLAKQIEKLYLKN